MALTPSQQLQQRKEQKFKRELTRALSNVPSKKLDALIGRYFSKNQYTHYSQDMFVDIVTASKHGRSKAVRHYAGVRCRWESSAVNERDSGAESSGTLF